MSEFDINARLEQLEKDYESGKRAMADCEGDRQRIGMSLIRIEGAMTMLREQGGLNPAELAAKASLDAQRLAAAKEAFPDVVGDGPLTPESVVAVAP